MAESDAIIAVSIVFGVLATLICSFCAIRFYVMFYQRRHKKPKKQLDIQEILAKQREGKRKSESAKTKRKKSKKKPTTSSTFERNPVYGIMGEKDEEKQSLLSSPSPLQSPSLDLESDREGDESTIDEELGDDMLENPSDELLLRSFKEILSNGVDLVLHQVETKPKACVLTLEGKVLTVKSGLFSQQQRLFLKGMKKIEAGKTTVNFNSREGLEVPEGLCFSILSSSDSLDFECSSKMERQALFQGFKLLLEEQIQKQNR